MNTIDRKKRATTSFIFAGVNAFGLILFVMFFITKPDLFNAVFLAVNAFGVYVNYQAGVKHLSFLELRKETDMRSG